MQPCSSCALDSLSGKMANIQAIISVFILLLLLHSQPCVLGAIWPNHAVKNNSSLECIEMERKALLKLKESLNDPFHCLSSWVGNDCCNWEGVICNKQTRNVIRLQLRGTDICSKAKNKSSSDIH